MSALEALEVLAAACAAAASPPAWPAAETPPFHTFAGCVTGC